MFDGGNFFQGFVAGALGSLGAKGWTGLVGENVANNGGMIAFGALAGGIGAELSGGNFFKGFLQGGIVAGLNDGMHQIAQNNRIRNSLSEPDGVPDKNIESVNEIKSEVKGLFTKDMLNADKSSIVVESISNKNSNFDGNTTTTYGENNGAIGSEIKVQYNNSAFSSNYRLAKTILHEFYHAADYLTNRWSLQYYNSKYKMKIMGNSLNNSMIDWAEKRAYKFVRGLGVPESIYNRKIYIK